MRSTTWLKQGPWLLVLGLIVSLTGSTFGFLYFERDNLTGEGFLGGLYWTVTTMTTVGYGDLTPKTPAGRVLAVATMIAGLGLVSSLTGVVASMLVEFRARQRKGLLSVKLNNHIVILGWNGQAQRFIAALKDSRTLDASELVLVNELSPEERDDAGLKAGLGDKLHFVHGSPGLESVVTKAAPAKARAVYILSSGQTDPKLADQQSVYAALTVRALAPKTRIYAEVVMAENAEHLLKAGVNEVVSRGEVSGAILGVIGSDPSMWPFFRGLIGLRGPSLLEHRPLSPEDRRLDYGSFVRAIRDRDGALPLAVCEDGKSLSLSDVLDEGSALDQYIMELFAASGRETELGEGGAKVFVNPPDDLSLATWDGCIVLKRRTEAL